MASFFLKRDTLKAMGIIMAVSLLVGLFVLLCHNFIPTRQDSDEATKILDAVEAQFPFRGNDHGRRTVYYSPHPRYTEILIYGEYSEAEKNQICGIVRAVRKEKASKPIWVSFQERKQKTIREVIP